MSGTIATTWRRIGLAVVTTLASAGALYAAASVWERVELVESLRWRVPRMERTLEELRLAETVRATAEKDKLLQDAVRHQELLKMLKEIKERRGR